MANAAGGGSGGGRSSPCGAADCGKVFAIRATIRGSNGVRAWVAGVAAPTA